MQKNWIDRIKADQEKIKKLESYYGIKYGIFSWVRGTIDIYDTDDLTYIGICIQKIKQRLEKESTEKIKNQLEKEKEKKKHG